MAAIATTLDPRDMVWRFSPRAAAWTAAGSAGAAVLAARPGHQEWPAAGIAAGFAALLVVLAAIDFRTRLLPNVLTYPGALVALLATPAWPDRDWTNVLFGGGLALTAAGAVYLTGIAYSRGKGIAFGLGDVKLALLIGLLLGWPGGLYALWAGVLLSIIGVAWALATGRRSFPYGPWLAAGALLGLWGWLPFTA